MGDKFYHYHVSMGSDLKLIQEMDKEKVKELATSFGELAKNMSDVSMSGTLRKTKAVMAWSAASTSAITALVLVCGGLWCVTWLLTSIRSLINGN